MVSPELYEKYPDRYEVVGGVIKPKQRVRKSTRTGSVVEPEDIKEIKDRVKKSTRSPGQTSKNTPRKKVSTRTPRESVNKAHPRGADVPKTYAFQKKGYQVSPLKQVVSSVLIFILVIVIFVVGYMLLTAGVDPVATSPGGVSGQTSTNTGILRFDRD